MAINSVTIVGRVCRDIELRHTPSGVPVVTFSVAVDRPYKSGEERQADFIDCVAWRGTAEFISQYFSKGSDIGVVGLLQTRNYETQDGQRRKAVEVSVKEVSFVGRKATGEEKPATQNAETASVDTEDIPF